MPLRWQTLAIVAALFLGLWMIWTNQQPADLEAEPLSFGEGPIPDVIMTGVDLTRYDANGRVTLTATATTMTSFEEQGETFLADPVIYRHQGDRIDWQIESNEATLYNNNDLVFTGSVVATYFGQDGNRLLTTELLSVRDQQQRIETDQPVRISGPGELTTATGLTALLDQPQPIIELHQDVTFRYDTL